MPGGFYHQEASGVWVPSALLVPERRRCKLLQKDLTSYRMLKRMPLHCRTANATIAHLRGLGIREKANQRGLDQIWRELWTITTGGVLGPLEE
jgi:hypothetical protein